ncbi:MAG TPA: hypothetical protein VGI58_03795 [Streptosporangiaceae bacterium]
MDELDRVGAVYLAHLTDADLEALVHADEVPAAEAETRIRALRRSPALLLDVLDRPSVTASVLNLSSADPRQRFALISPFLVFAAAIHRVAADLRGSGYVPERTTPRLRIPVFDGPQLAGYLAQAEHRLFLAELLASFARSSSGVIVTRTPHGLRRRRWNDLDLGRLVMLLDSLPEPERPPVWRRLGDLTLFLAGVYPAAIERVFAGRLDPVRLASVTGLSAPPSGSLDAAGLFEWLGAGWYRLAASRATAETVAGAFAPAAVIAPPGSRSPALPAAGSPGSAGRPGATATSSALSRAAGGPRSAAATTTAALRDNADHFHQARRVLNATTDRYLFPLTTEWFTPPG